jgi:hypothetical protein
MEMMMTDTPYLLLHLTTGQDIIGEVTRTPAGYDVQQPAMPQIHIDQAAQAMRIGIAPLHPWDRPEDRASIHLDMSHVLYTRPLPEQMVNAYLQYRSGLIMGAPTGPASPSLASLLKG